MNLGPRKRATAIRHCGFVVSELDGFGAGSEGWIDDPSLLLAMSFQLLALAKERMAMIVGWEGEDNDAPPPVSIRLPTVEDGHQIKAMEWVCFQRWSVLAVGTTQGSVLFYSSRGALLMRQIFQPSPVLQLRVRGSYNKSSQHSCVEDLCVVYPKAISRIDVSDLQPLLHRCLRDADDRERKGNSGSDEVDFSLYRVAHEVWNVSRNTGAYSTCVDGVIAGVMAPPLLEHQSKQRYFCAISVGPDCTFAAHRLSEDRRSSITNLIMRRIMPATVSTISALARVLTRTTVQPEATDSRPAEVKPQDFGRSSLITSLKDPPRKGETIALCPSGTMAAVTDSLGRILLIDTQSLVVIRLWKGYRDAQCFFLEIPADDQVESASHLSSYSATRKQDLTLCLAIYAPRRGAVEIWKLRDGPRVAMVKCGRGCRVIQPACEFQGPENYNKSKYERAEVYILYGDSRQLVVISPHLSLV